MTLGHFIFLPPKKKIPLVWVVCTGSFLSPGREISPQKEAGGDSLQQQCLGGLSPSPFDTTWLVLMYVGMGLDGDHSVTSHLNSILAKGHGGKQSLLPFLKKFKIFLKNFKKIVKHHVQCDHWSYPPNQMLTSVHLNLGNGLHHDDDEACNNLSSLWGLAALESQWSYWLYQQRLKLYLGEGRTHDLKDCISKGCNYIWGRRELIIVDLLVWWCINKLYI